MNGNLIWLEVDAATLDRIVRDAQAAIRRGANEPHLTALPRKAVAS